MNRLFLARPALFFVLLMVPVVHAEENTIDFSRDIRPILNRHCTACHGGVKQAGDVSFVHADQVLPPEGWVVEPGDAESSLLIERILSDDPDERMPPPEEHPDPIPDEEVELLKRWINEGAKWSDSWALEPLEPSQNLSRDGSPIFRLISRHWKEHVLQGAPEASPQEWLRRVSFDLIGLPPSLEQSARFVAACDQAGSVQDLNAVYESCVDEILQSPHFGERWASVWMDLARYADSKGFEKDPHRDMWPYRDWLIRSFNADMPYDQFTIKQLAGDLLPAPTADDLIATAFHRNTQTNTEGGTDDEEFRVAAMIDRVDTTWTVWQATTMGCVRCHSHPYDPIRNEEYYASMAYFDNSVDADLPDDFPIVTIPIDAAQRNHAVESRLRLEQLRQQRNRMGYSVAQSLDWENLSPASVATTGGRLKIEQDTVLTDGGTFPVGVQYTVEFPLLDCSALRLEIFPETDDPKTWPTHGAVLSQLKIHILSDEGENQEVAVEDVFADSVSGPDDPRDALDKSSAGVGEYPKLTGPRKAIFVLGKSISADPTKRLRLTMVQKANTAGNLATPIRKFRWSRTNTDALREVIESDELKETDSALQQAKKDVQAIKGAKLPVILSRPDEAARTTRFFIRGNWLEKGKVVTADIPAVFQPQGSTSVVSDRLSFARWLVSDQNPLAARVWANRIWAQLFGRGIVATLEDFGSSGMQPTHPELLDYLAAKLRDDYDWHLKPFLKELVLSPIYRQTHHASKQHQAIDPGNQWLARGPRTRLTAEMIRDQALLAAGLLNREVGGPSVMPPQPDGVWQTVYNGAKWETANDDRRFRRGLYTYWRRTSPYPSFLTFDAPTRDLCSARRIATNTPLQALVTLNDPVYVECSQALADRAIERDSGSIDVAVKWIFRSVTGRSPHPKEAEELRSLYNDLCRIASETDQDRSSDKAETETEISVLDANAMAIVANTILNLDQSLTK